MLARRAGSRLVLAVGGAILGIAAGVIKIGPASNPRMKMMCATLLARSRYAEYL